MGQRFPTYMLNKPLCLFASASFMDTAPTAAPCWSICCTVTVLLLAHCSPARFHFQSYFWVQTSTVSSFQASHLLRWCQTPDNIAWRWRPWTMKSQRENNIWVPESVWTQLGLQPCEGLKLFFLDKVVMLYKTVHTEDPKHQTWVRGGRKGVHFRQQTVQNFIALYIQSLYTATTIK